MKRPSVPRRCSPLALSLLFLTLFGVPPLAAQPFGFTSPEAMYRLNLADGTTEDMPVFGGAYGLAYAPDGVLYGVFWGKDVGLLATLDPEAGVFEEVGSLAGIDGISGALTFDARRRLWFARFHGDLYQVDPATAQATLAAGSLLPADLWVDGMTACDDRLVVLASTLGLPSRAGLFVIDPDSLAVSTFGPDSADLVADGGGLDFDAEGRLWAVLDRINAIPDPFAIDGIAEIDPATGAVLSSQTVQLVGWSLGFRLRRPSARSGGHRWSRCRRWADRRSRSLPRCWRWLAPGCCGGARSCQPGPCSARRVGRGGIR